MRQSSLTRIAHIGLRIGSIIVSIIVCLGLIASCGDQGNESQAADDTAPPMGMPACFPTGALRVPGPGDLVLVEGLHGIRLTLQEYNARVEEQRLPVDSDTLESRWIVLERLVDHKVVAAEGRLRGYQASGVVNVREEERQLVRQVLEQGMLEAQLIPATDVKAFFAANPELFPDMSVDDLEDPALRTHVQFTLHNQRWRARVDEWRIREEVVVHRDRFESLMTTPDSGSSGPTQEESES